MKKFMIIGIAVLAVVLLLGFVLYASNQDKPTATKTDVIVQKAEKCSHEAGSAECLEKLAKGECKGHELGLKCIEKHANGECKGHEPGLPHKCNEEQKKQ